MSLPCGFNIQDLQWKILSLFAQICPYELFFYTFLLRRVRCMYFTYYIIEDCRKVSVVFLNCLCYSRYRKSTHSKVDAPEMVKCPYGHRLSCGSDRIGIFISSYCFSYRERSETQQSNCRRKLINLLFL